MIKPGISPDLAGTDRVFLAATRAMGRLQGLEAMLGAPVVRSRGSVRGAEAVLAWGRKPSALQAERLAGRLRLPVLRLEDGFLRSVGLGADEPPLSIVVDDTGIYYDASTPSRLESLTASPLSEEQHARARQLVRSWRAARVSKYNHGRESAWTAADRTSLPAYVLVIDQTLGDDSIRHGQADAASFERMLEAALAEHPDCVVLLKVHPEVIAGRKDGHFDLAALKRHRRIRIVGQDVHPVPLIEHARAVYVVTSQVGFEGLLWGKPVRTFGMPFYAGWGLTGDELPPLDRRKTVPLEQLVHAALVAYPRYLDPETGKRCEAERLIEWMALQRAQRERFPAEIAAPGYSLWKKPIVKRFLQGSKVRFMGDVHGIAAGDALAVWGMSPVGGAGDGTVLRLEDGFLRSVGLGADLVRPLSWVVDSRGMYYDASGPSDLEHILQTMPFERVLLDRAKTLRERIVAHGVTKYNVGADPWQRPAAARRVVLVPGQVESDASVRFGTREVRTNIALLRAVRAAAPDAYVVYKSHPDVSAGLRKQGTGENEAGSWCDEIVTDVPMGALLDAVDEVHVLTSLAGFEALLRRKRVVTYGQPFYAGWGLTEDREPVSRRTRRLSLDEMTAGVLILYPLYVSRITDRYTTPEQVLDELAAWRTRSTSGLPLWRRGLRVALRLGSRVR